MWYYYIVLYCNIPLFAFSYAYAQFILEARQMKLFTELVISIYPIERVATATNGGANNSIGDNEGGHGRSVLDDEYTIRGIELPMIIDTRCVCTGSV
jgi:hypothetical protein